MIKAQSQGIFKVTGNLYVKFLLIIISHYKIWPRQELCNFYDNDLELAQMTLVQDHDLPIFVWRRNIHFFFIRKKKNGHKLWTFPSSDLKISQMTFLHAVLMFSGLVSHTRADVSGGVWFVESWHILRSKAIYVWTSNVPSFKRYGPDTIAQTDGQTYRKSDSYKPPPSNFVCEGYNHKLTNFGHIFNIL